MESLPAPLESGSIMSDNLTGSTDSTTLFSTGLTRISGISTDSIEESLQETIKKIYDKKFESGQITQNPDLRKISDLGKKALETLESIIGTQDVVTEVFKVDNNIRTKFDQIMKDREISIPPLKVVTKIVETDDNLFLEYQKIVKKLEDRFLECKNNSLKYKKEVLDELSKFNDFVETVDIIHKKGDFMDSETISFLKDKLEEKLKYLESESGTVSKIQKALESCEFLRRVTDITPRKDFFNCPVCLTNQVDTTLIPCGHTFCKDCIKTLVCPICRGKSKLLKLYFV